jgi:mevalonate kinase
MVSLILRFSTFDILIYTVSSANEDSSNPIKPTEEVQAVLKTVYDNIPSAASQGTIAVVYLVGKILMKHIEELSGLIVKIKSQGLPIGAGLGSSAAFSVATSASCWQLEHRLQLKDTENKSNLTLDKTTLSKINAWAFMAEILIHGTPSGLDNTTSTFGGMLKFKKLENGNEFINLDQIPNNLQILLTNTKVPRSTKVLVAGVRTLYNALPSVVQPIFLSVEEVTNTFVDTLMR